MGFLKTSGGFGGFQGISEVGSSRMLSRSCQGCSETSLLGGFREIWKGFPESVFRWCLKVFMGFKGV